MSDRNPGSRPTPKRTTKGTNMFATKGRHMAPTTSKNRRRRILGIPFAGWMIMAMGGTALALWYIANGFAGSVTTGSADINYVTGTASTVSGDCTVSVTDFDELTISWADAWAGDQCQVQVAVKAPVANSFDMQIQSVTAPAGLIATAGAWCGAGSNYAAGLTGNQTVQFNLEVDELTASPGQTITFDPLVDGLQWVRASDYNAGACS